MNAFVLRPEDPRVMAKLIELLQDKDTNVKNVAIGHAGSTVGALAQPGSGVVALRVLPEPTEEAEVLQLLDQVESAVKRLQDTGDGLDEGQRRIIDEVILPLLNELRGLFTTTAETSAGLRLSRLRSIFTLGNVAGAAKGVALSTSTLANTPEASGAVVEAVKKLEPIIRLIGDLV